MAHLQRRDPENDGQKDVIRSWDPETRNGFPGPYQGSESFKKQSERAIDLLNRQKWLILLTCLIVIGGVALYTYSQVPVYRASSLVLVDKDKSTSEGGFGNQGLGFLSSSESSLENELIFLKNSQALQAEVANKLVKRGKARRVLVSEDTSVVGRLSHNLLGSFQKLFGIAHGSRSERDSVLSLSRGDEEFSSAVASVVKARVQFGRANQKTDNVIRISAEDEDPKIARLLAELYAEEYIALTRESSRESVEASSRFLQKRAEELKQELETIERRIQQYQRRQDAVNLDQREGSLANRLANTESELEKARIELRMNKSSLKSLQEELKSIRPQQLSERMGSTAREEIEALQSKIAKLELSKQELQLQAGRPTAADSAQLSQINKRIQKLRSRISRLSDKYVGEIMAKGLSAEQGAQRVDDLKRRIAEKKIQISGIEARIKTLSERLREYESELNKIPQKSMELAQLRREQKYKERMYGYVTKQLQETRVKEKSELGYASKVARATIPENPVRPRPGRNLILSLIFGLLGGAGVALIRDRMDNRIYKPDQIQQMGYSQIGVIPDLTSLVEDQLDGQATVEWEGHQLESNLVGILKPYSAATEAYRKVWTNLQLGRPDGGNTSILITSAGAGDGKTLTAANLAVVIAQAGHSTLLIDGDLRRPRLHEVFDLSRAPGVVEAFQSETPDDFRGHLQEHGLKNPLIDNLFFLPGGTEAENPTKFLRSARFREYIHRANQHFDQIIVDTSPVLATADGSLLSDLCDMTLLIARAGVTTEDELEYAMEALHDVGANIGGVVFNGFDISMAYGYKYRYRHYGEYGAYDQYRSLPEEASV